MAAKLAIIGDSISAGFSPSTHGWSVPLAQLNVGANWGVKNVAHAGDKVAAAQLVFDKDVLGRGATWVAFLIGTNDLPDGTAAATIYATINTMATQAEAMGARVLLLAILPRATGPTFSVSLETRRVALNALMAARAGSVYVDTSTGLTGTAAATAFALDWTPISSYLLDQVAVNGGNAYVVTTAGTSGASGPTGTGTGIVDGSVVWDYAPALGSAYGGATDGLHPNDAGQLQIATLVQAAVVAAGGW